MSLTFTASITPATFNPRAVCYDPAVNFAYIVESNLPSFRAYNLALQTLVASGSVIASPSGIALINSASAVVINTNATSTSNFVEVGTGYTTTVSIANSNTTNQTGQYIAGDAVLGIAFSCTSTAKRVIKFAAAGQTATGITLSVPANFIPRSILLKSSGRWLVGGDFGKVYEIDSSGNIVDDFTVTYDPNTAVLTNYTSGALDSARVCAMSYDNNMLLVAVAGYIMLYDYSTKTKLWQQSAGSQSNDQTILSNSSSGVCLMSVSNTTSQNNTIQELDFTIAGVQVRDILHSDATDAICSIAAHTLLNSAVFLQLTSNKIRVLGLTPRATVTRTFTVNPNGIDQKFRLLLIDDSVSPPTRMLDTYAQSPATYRIVPGKAVLELVKVGNGTSAQWDYSEYTT